MITRWSRAISRAIDDNGSAGEAPSHCTTVARPTGHAPGPAPAPAQRCPGNRPVAGWNRDGIPGVQGVPDASRPTGGPAPTGRYASLVLDPHTFDALDLGLHENSPPVSPESLGP